MFGNSESTRLWDVAQFYTSDRKQMKNSTLLVKVENAKGKFKQVVVYKMQDWIMQKVGWLLESGSKTKENKKLISWKIVLKTAIFMWSAHMATYKTIKEVIEKSKCFILQQRWNHENIA